MNAIGRLCYFRNLVLFTVALLLATGYLILPVFMANRALHPQRYPVNVDLPNDLGLIYEEVQFTTADGLLLHGWFIPAQDPADSAANPNGAAVIALHAYNGNRSGVINHAILLARHGYAVLAIDLRAHGESQGGNFTFGWDADQDVFAAMDYLHSRPEIDPNRIGVLGLSIGAEVGLQAAAGDKRIQAVVAEGAGYRTFDEFLIEPGLRGWLLLPGDWVFFKSGELLGGVSSPPPLTELTPQIAPRPVMLIAAGIDRPYNQVYYEAAKAPKHYWDRNEPGHIDALLVHPEQYEGEVIKKATNERLDLYSTRLFDPLGVTDYEWDFINEEVVHASGNLKLRPRDMAKFGYLYLNQGQWAGRQIISPEWVVRSSIPYIPPPIANNQGYGYQWWFREFPYRGGQVQAQYAAGWGGQYIYLFPTLDLIVVTTGGNYASYDPVDELITKHILPAIP